MDTQTITVILVAVIGTLAALCTALGIKAANNVPLKYALLTGVLLAKMTPSDKDDAMIKDVASKLGVDLSTGFGKPGEG